MGTLIQKIQCQEMPCTTAPPTSGPIATAAPEMPDQTPSAIPRRSAGKASASSVSVSGVTSAAPAPWTARASDEQVGGGRERGPGGGGGEERETGQEHAPASEAVAERGAGQQQDGVGEDVGVDGPLERLDRGAEVAVDRGQRDRDDEIVEDDHEERHRDDPEGPAVPATVAARPAHRIS